MANENYPIIVGGLKKIGNFFIKELKYELKEQEHIATGKLFNSFYSDIYEQFGNLYLDVTSDLDYLWLVNDGASMGVDVDEATIKSWAAAKGIRFNNPKEEARFAESVVRQKLFDRAFEQSGNITCLDTDEYFDGAMSKEQLEYILSENRNTLFHTQWIQYTDTNTVRVDGPWGYNLKDRVGSYSDRGIFNDASMHSEHLPVPEKQAMINAPNLFIAHLQWMDKKTVAVKQYYWKVVDYVNKIEHGVEIIPTSAYDASVNNFEWEYEPFEYPLKVRSDVYDLHDIEDSFKYKFIKESIEKYNIPNLNDWGMGIH